MARVSVDAIFCYFLLSFPLMLFFAIFCYFLLFFAIYCYKYYNLLVDGIDEKLLPFMIKSRSTYEQGGDFFTWNQIATAI